MQQAEHAGLLCRVSCQILEHSMQQLHSMCMSIRDAPGLASSSSANLSSDWERALVADLKSTMQQTVSFLKPLCCFADCIRLPLHKRSTET